MSPCNGSVCLLVLLGVMLASGGPLQFISETLKHTQESIADELELKQPEIGSNPLFSFVFRSVNASCQRREEIQLMNATLDVYMRIFSSILQHRHHQHHLGKTGTSGLLDRLSDTKRSEVESALIKLQQRMENLRSHLGRLHHDREDALSKLNKIKVDDPMVQRKALAEFLEVYQTASVIGAQRC